MLIINHENVTNCLFTGNPKNMLITNVLFRLGGACAIMSNRNSNPSHIPMCDQCKPLRAPRPPQNVLGCCCFSKACGRAVSSALSC